MLPACHAVLIVEDNDDMRDALSTALQVAGCEVAPAWSVEDALRQLHQGFTPCVVLLDLHMPGMNGWGFLDRLRVEPHLHETPVIVVSGDAGERAEAKQRGCEFFLKGTPNATLVASISRHCRAHPRSP